MDDPRKIYGPAADAWAFQALAFLERSRDVANEVVVDGTRAETSTSAGERSAEPRSGPERPVEK
ncbi:MAG: hypothetical protein ACREVV_16200 [Steroidobacteraceae bacterium]